jgi:transcription antitermination factor NusG
MSIPLYGSYKEALRFAKRNTNWIKTTQKKLKARTPKMYFNAGTMVKLISGEFAVFATTKNF